MRSNFIIIFALFLNIDAFSQDIFAHGSYKSKLDSKELKNPDFLNNCVLLAKRNAIEATLGAEISSKSGRYVEETIVNSHTSYNKIISDSILVNVKGIWIKDIEEPLFEYYSENGINYVEVKVHGYVAKKPNKTEAREELRNRFADKQLLDEGVQLHSVEYYPNDFAVSIVILDKNDYSKNPSDMGRIAGAVATNQISEFFNGLTTERDVLFYLPKSGTRNLDDAGIAATFERIKNSSSGWIRYAPELLAKFQLPDASQWAFIYVTEIE